MKKISILIPAYNEEEVLEPLYQRLGKLANDNKAYEFEFLFINDGSTPKKTTAWPMLICHVTLAKKLP
jgi:glycosyltransferase involved in cell wall biosynthesis